MLTGLVLASAGGFAQHHFDHYAARAAINGSDIMAEIRAAPICTDSAARG